MATNTENNIQINQFTKGLNTDTSYQFISSDQYSMAKNIRMSVLNSDGSGDNSNAQGQIKSIEGVSKQLEEIFDFTITSILASSTIRDCGIIIVEDEQFIWHVIRIDYIDGRLVDANDIFHSSSKKDRLGGINGADKVSIQLRYEDYDNIKLYIADGEHYLMVINILDDEYNQKITGDISKIQAYQFPNIDPPIFNKLISGNLKPGMVQYSYALYNKNGVSTEISVPTKLIPIVYSKNSNWEDGKQIYGDDYDQEIGIGVNIKINIPIDLEYLQKILIYRIYYTQNGQTPTIDLIYDVTWINNGTVEDGVRSLYFSDTGQAGLQTLTLEEYNGQSGIHIIPKVIESKYDYLFAANIKDNSGEFDRRVKDFDSRSYSYNLNKQAILYNYANRNEDPIIVTNNYDDVPETSDCFNIYNDMSVEYPDENHKGDSQFEEGVYCRYDLDGYYGGTGKYISWKFVITQLDADTHELATGANYGTTGSNIELDNSYLFTTALYYAYVKHDGTIEQAKDFLNMHKQYSNSTYGGNYSNPSVSYALKSLRRDELYRYGIILYDGRGESSSVKWIADVRTPGINYDGFNSFLFGGHSQTTGLSERINLVVRPLGIQFNVNIQDYNENVLKPKLQEELGELYDDSYLIQKYEIVRCNRSEQDICTITQGVVSRPIKKILNSAAYKENNVEYPYTPTGILTTANYWTGVDWIAYQNQDTNKEDDGQECSNYTNHSIYQFVSPEVLYQKDGIQELIQNKNTVLNPISYLFNQSYNYSPDIYWTPEYGQMYTDRLFAFSSRDRMGHDVKGRFLQAGQFNMSLAMTPPDIFNTPIIGDDSADNLMDGISLKSIFEPVGYVVSSFYSFSPVDHAFPGDSTDWQGSYAPISNRDYLTPQTYTIQNRNTMPIVRNVYGYSKLYQQSNHLYIRKYGYTDYESTVGSKTEYEEVDLKQNNYSCGITDFKIANEIAWNELYEDVKNGENNTVQFKYPDTLTSVGTSGFINCVCGPTLNDPNYLKEEGSILNTTGGTVSEGDLDDTLVGCGGRTAVISIDDNNILYKTIATDEIEYASRITEDGTIINNSKMSAKDNYDSLEKGAWETFTYNDIPDYYRYDTLTNDGDKYIFRNSVCGTYLCNVRSNVVPYGGYDYTSRTLNTYYSYGDISSENICNVFNGDCFIMPMEYVSMHKYYYPKIKYPVTSTFIYAIPVETNINLSYTYGQEFSRNQNDSNVTNLQIEPSDVNGYFTQQHPLYAYNTTYSSNSYTVPYAAYLNEDDDNTLKNLDYRCHYSNLKVANENVDSWTRFMPINYLDVDSKYGSINNMRAFKDKLFFWQDMSVGVFSVNERSQITDDSNQSLILGTGGILSRYDYVDQTSGMSPEKYCDAMSNSALYWYDDKNKELKQFNQGIHLLNSEHQTQNLMKEQGSGINPQLFFDNRYSELVSKVLCDDNELSYSEKYNLFTSLYTIPYDSYLQFYQNTYLVKQNNNKLEIYKWNDLQEGNHVDTQGNVIPTYVQYVVNENPLITKIFDNQEIVTSELVGSPDYDENQLTNMHTYTWSTDLHFTSTDNLRMTDREGNFRYAIPRAQKNGVQHNYGNRLRGKYMICSIEDCENKYDTSISFIITKFRQSWI